MFFPRAWPDDPGSVYCWGGKLKSSTLTHMHMMSLCILWRGSSQNLYQSCTSVCNGFQQSLAPLRHKSSARTPERCARRCREAQTSPREILIFSMMIGLGANFRMRTFADLAFKTIGLFPGEWEQLALGATFLLKSTWPSNFVWAN